MIRPFALVDDREVHHSVAIHPSAVIDMIPSASPSLARPGHASRLLRVGARTEVMPFALLYRGAHIGSDCLIGNHATVREHATIGDRCIIGQYVCVSFDAELADEVRVQNGTYIGHGWKIGRGTFIGINVSTMSDRRRDLADYEYKGACPTTIGERCLIGSGAVILPGLTIGNDVVIGAGALVTRDIPDGATVLGQPSRIVGEEQRQQMIAQREMAAAFARHQASTPDEWDESGERQRA